MSDNPYPLTHEELLARIAAAVRAVRAEAAKLPPHEVAYQISENYHQPTGHLMGLTMALCAPEPLPPEQWYKLSQPGPFSGTDEEVALWFVNDRSLYPAKNRYEFAD